MTGFTEYLQFSEYTILGELALDGKVRRINGALPITLELKGFLVKLCFVFADKNVVKILSS